jgi:lipopolysaccharide transport system permease protein
MVLEKTSWIRPMLHALWRYRGFVLSSVKREFQARYRNSLLGAAWTVLNPLAMITVYTVIFAQVMHSRMANVDSMYGYGIYLCAGLLPWGFFAEITGRSTDVFIEHATLMKKLSFPRICLPCIVVLSAAINFFIVMGVFLAFLLLSRNFPGWAVLGCLPVFLVQIIFSIGLGITLGVFNVFFRDVGQLFSIILQFWFWFTPIVYPASVLPANIAKIMKLNPMVHIITAYQQIFLYHTWPNWSSLLYPCVLGLLLCALGLRLFRRHVGEMVDEL